MTTVGDGVEALGRDFEEAGLTREAALIWASFVDLAMKLTRLGEERLKQPANWGSLLAKVSGDSPDEDDISVELYHSIDAIKDEASLASEFHRIEVKRDAPVFDEGRTGKRSRRMDFRVKEWLGAGRHTTLAVEAKLLRRISDVGAHYLGNEGIRCFVTTDSPYTSAPVGMMFAYFLSGERDTWLGAIDREIARSDLDARIIGGVRSKRHSVDLHSVLPRRDLGWTPISVLHAAFDFSKCPVREKS
jgi:hypothetical protein